MARTDGSIVIDTKILEDGFRKGIAGLSRLAKTAGVAIGAGILAAGAALGALAVKGVQLASDLQEVQNVVDVTFGDNAKVINDWAKAAGDAFGVSELMAKKMTGTMGAMLKSMGLTEDQVLDMSVGLAGLVGDLSSFYNLEHEEAFEKIRSGLSGEIEPLKALGINMSEVNLEAYALSKGITKPWQKMTESEKAVLRYGYLMQVTADAQGDFARTSDSFANQQRILSMQVDTLAASFGSRLIPALSKGMGGVMGWFDQMTPAFDMLFAGIGLAVDGDPMGLAGEYISKSLSEILNSLVEGIGRLGTTLIPALAEIAVSLIEGIVPMMAPLAGALINGLMVIAEALPALIPTLVSAFGDVISVLAEALPTLVPLLADAFLTLVEAAMSVLGELEPILQPIMVEVMLLIVSEIIKHLPLLLGAGAQLVGGIIEGMLAMLPQIAAMGPQLIADTVRGFMANLPAMFKAGNQGVAAVVRGFMANISFLGSHGAAAGRALIHGIGAGIASSFSWLVGRLRSFATDVTDKLKAFFGISSPSKLFEAEIGVNLALGVGRGFTKTMSSLAGDMSRAVTGEMSRFTLAAAPTAARAMAGPSTSNQTVIFQSPPRTYSEVVRAMSDIERGLAW